MNQSRNRRALVYGPATDGTYKVVIDDPSHSPDAAADLALSPDTAAKQMSAAGITGSALDTDYFDADGKPRAGIPPSLAAALKANGVGGIP